MRGAVGLAGRTPVDTTATYPRTERSTVKASAYSTPISLPRR